MPAKKGSKSKNMFIGELARNRKAVAEENRQKILENDKAEISSQNLTIDSLRQKLKRKKTKINIINNEINSLSGPVVAFSSSLVKRRLNNPTTLSLPNKSKVRRRSQTFEMANIIHGGSSENRNLKCKMQK